MFYIDGALKEKPVLVVDAMFGQLVGVCVRKYLHRYDATYRIRYTGAFDIAGNALPDFEFDLKTRPRKEPGTERPEHDALVLEASRETSILLKNENNALPIEMKSGENALILITAASRRAVGEFSAKLLEEKGVLPDNAVIDSMVMENNTEASKKAAMEADHVIIISRAWDISCMDPTDEDGYHINVVNDIIDSLHKAGKTAIVISAQLPYDAACYPEADAILLTYFSSYMTVIPNHVGEGSAWAPNLPAAVCAVFGAEEATGKLPVNIPKLDENFNMTDEIMYYRQTGE
jgi:beta-N-acetylhexosaminidase